MKDNIKTLISKIISAKAFSVEISEIVSQYYTEIQSGKIANDIGDEVDYNQVIEIYSRRKESLDSRGLPYLGIDELLDSLKRTRVNTRMLRLEHELYNFIIFFNGELDTLLGIVIMDRQRNSS